MTSSDGKLPLTAEGIKKALVRSGSSAARRQFVVSLKKEIEGYEIRYRIRSDLLDQALAAGTVKENVDIAKWELALDSLRRIEHGRKAQLERSGELPTRRAKSA